MNYRHAFHAGNFADVMKHALLARILTHLLRKPAPFRVIDTHAGIGRYDLDGVEAGKTGEWQDGIGRLDTPLRADAEALLEPYRRVLAATRARHGALVYPGSPAILREMLRPVDRAVLVEKHPADAALLAERYREAATLKVMALDGWTALKSTVPPRERRGLVLIDPPFEEPGEFERSVGRIASALTRWPTGILAFWYPVKNRRETDAFGRALAHVLTRETIRLELMVGPAADGRALAGSGLLVVNPPWTLLAEAEILMPALAERLGRQGTGEARCDVLVGA